jgi:hypothetical protein
MLVWTAGKRLGCRISPLLVRGRHSSPVTSLGKADMLDLILARPVRLTGDAGEKQI